MVQLRIWKKGNIQYPTSAKGIPVGEWTMKKLCPKRIMDFPFLGGDCSEGIPLARVGRNSLYFSINPKTKY